MDADEVHELLKQHTADDRTAFEAINGKLDELLEVVNRAKGGWRMLIVVGTILSFMVAGIWAVIKFITGH